MTGVARLGDAVDVWRSGNSGALGVLGQSGGGGGDVWMTRARACTIGDRCLGLGRGRDGSRGSLVLGGIATDIYFD